MVLRLPRVSLYVAILIVGVAAATFGTVGMSLASDSGTSEAGGELCEGKEQALLLLDSAAQLDDLTPYAAGDVNLAIRALEESIILERSGGANEANSLDIRLLRHLMAMAANAKEADNEELADLLVEAVKALATCIDRPNIDATTL